MRCCAVFSLLLVILTWPPVSAEEEPATTINLKPVTTPTLVSTTKSQEPRSVVLPLLLSQDINHEDFYFSQLLILAMDKTVDPYGPWHKHHNPTWLRDKRLRVALARGEVDVLWSQTNASYETEMRAVKFPLLKGLGHYRLLLIRAEDQPRYDRVTTLQQLGKFTGGMGAQWPDLPVMKANSLPQVTAPGYGKLFRMLAAGRFDYFSRGIYQIQSEVDFYPELPLAIEKNLILSYPSDFFFFVEKDNRALADRILMGLQKAERDGSFDKLFNQVPRYRWAMKELEANTRRVLRLKLPQ